MSAPEGRLGSNSALRPCRSVSGLPKSGHDWAIYEYTSELDAARRSRALAGQAPLHGLHATGIAAGGDDAEVAARLFEGLRVDVRLGGGFLYVRHPPRAIGELRLQEPLCALTALGWLRDGRGHGFACRLAGLLPPC